MFTTNKKLSKDKGCLSNAFQFTCTTKKIINKRVTRVGPFEVCVHYAGSGQSFHFLADRNPIRYYSAQSIA